MTTGGLKAELIEKIKKAMTDKICVVHVTNNEAAPTTIFSPGTVWKTLNHLEEVLDDPNAGTNYHVPTSNFPDTVTKLAQDTLNKRNYGNIFDRPQLISTVNIDVLDRYKRRKNDPVINAFIT